MILVPTRICNTNNCNYCQVYKKDAEFNYFNNLVLDDFFVKLKFLSEKTWDKNLRFFWWEPFLKINVIKKIIKYSKDNNYDYSFIINSNLTLLKDDDLVFLKKHCVKMIVSCNWDVNSHSKTRWVSIWETVKLYENIKKIISYGIDYQINIVVTGDTVWMLKSNIEFIKNKLWWKYFNLLPVNYNGWNKEWLLKLKKQFDLIKKDIIINKFDIIFINHEINNEVALFNNEIVIDSDSFIYPSMVIMEDFFIEEKKKIFISKMINEIEDLKKDFEYWTDELNWIYSAYIKNVISKKFGNIVYNDNEASELFSNFLSDLKWKF